MPAYYPRCEAFLEVLIEDFGEASDVEILSLYAVPRSAEWIRDHHRSADTFSMELDYRDLPLDPRAVRAIRVLLLCGDVGSASGRLNLDNSDQQVFFGYVDEPETSLSASGEIVTLSGRDYTALFLDHTWSGGAIDVSVSLLDVVNRILQQTPGASSMPVAFSEATQNIVISSITEKRLWTPQPGDDTWTVLVNLCAVVGVLPRIELDTLYISTPDDFGDEGVSFLYGRDVERLSYRRKFNEARTQQIRVVCWDPVNRETREVLYPVEPIITRKTVPTQGKATVETAPQVRYPITGSYTEEQLSKIARGFYEEAARQQIEGRLSTRELSDVDGTPLPILSNGDRLEVRLGANLPNLAGLSDAEAIRVLTGARWGLSETVASALVRVWRQADSLASIFYVRTARHNWSISEGYKVELDFINYITAVG
ncbi:MAG: hypothetical protein AAFV53_32175 [Myxococcota bacterium]